jgi:hypothetical protein
LQQIYTALSVGDPAEAPISALLLAATVATGHAATNWGDSQRCRKTSSGCE